MRIPALLRTLCAGSVAALAAAAAAHVACLPELGVLPAADDAAVATGTGCGNGVIEEGTDGGAAEQCDRGDGGGAGCSAACTIECEGEIDPRTGHCYFKAGAHAALLEARQSCLAVSAHVVTVGDDDEAARAARLAAGEHWIGLERRDSLGGFVTTETSEPGWPLSGRSCAGCFGFADGGGLPRLDADSGASLGCVARGDGGAWIEVACTGGGARATVCEREPRGVRGQACGGGICFTLPTSEKRYLVVPSPSGAAEAASFCAAQFGGRLAVLASRAEREQLATELARFFPPEPVSTFWIGLAHGAGVWRWDDDAGLDAHPVPWGDGQPRGVAAGRAYLRLALEYDTQLAHADDDVTTARPFVCER